MYFEDYLSFFDKFQEFSEKLKIFNKKLKECFKKLKFLPTLSWRLLQKNIQKKSLSICSSSKSIFCISDFLELCTRIEA